MASKDSNGLVISLSIFVLLTVGMSVAWYMTWTHSTDLTRQLSQAQADKNTSDDAVRNLQSDISSLQALIGRSDAQNAVDDLVGESEAEIENRVSSATTLSKPETLEDAMRDFAQERDQANFTAAQETLELDNAQRALTKAEASYENAKAGLTQEVADKEAQLLAQESQHSEELQQLNDQIDELRTEKTAVQSEFSDYRESSEREIATLRDEISGQRDTLKKLRAAKFKLENLNFERPAGRLTFVDQASQIAFVNIGSRDKLRVGTTFSVYGVNNAGVGLPQSDRDLKGKLVITEIMGPALAKADIVDPKLGEPMASGDPVYSPIFSPGQAMEIAVVGALDFDGNPGSDREEFRRMVSANGARITLEVTDQAKILGEDGEELGESDISQRISSSTRFVLIGDLGDEDTQDTIQKELNNRIRALKVRMEEVATDNGVYVLSLSRFLDYIGYSRKSLAWSPTKPFPLTLPNGAKSRSVEASIGSRQASTGAEQALRDKFLPPARRRLPSTGATSALYRGTSNPDD